MKQFKDLWLTQIKQGRSNGTVILKFLATIENIDGAQTDDFMQNACRESGETH